MTDSFFGSWEMEDIMTDVELAKHLNEFRSRCKRDKAFQNKGEILSTDGWHEYHYRTFFDWMYDENILTGEEHKWLWDNRLRLAVEVNKIRKKGLIETQDKIIKKEKK